VGFVSDRKYSIHNKVIGKKGKRKVAGGAYTKNENTKGLVVRVKLSFGFFQPSFIWGGGGCGWVERPCHESPFSLHSRTRKAWGEAIVLKSRHRLSPPLLPCFW